eukprot:Colp12_sorted_trinity150504_noHs@25309
MADMTMSDSWPKRWDHIRKLTERSGPFASPGFEPSPEIVDAVKNLKILVIGAGGLGCEILKNLALSGFVDIHVIDMDTIDVSNLNRQFLFRPKDVGRPKAIVAAEFINNRVPGCKVTPYHNKIQDFGEDFYSTFNLVICGLDSIAARRWINGMLHSLLTFGDEGGCDPDGIIPMIDGGTEGFKGQARVIIPGMTACFECTLSMFPPQQTFPICTIASTPRQPEHCIQWAKILEWPKVRPDEALDMDNPEHVQWLFEHASARAAEFGIIGVTYRMTQGVAKNIIPAVASTNAAIAAACTNELFKLATSCSPYLQDYMMYSGGYGIYTHTFVTERLEDCLVCQQQPTPLQCSPSFLLSDVIQRLASDARFQMKAPGLRGVVGGQTKTLYMETPAALKQATERNLKKTLMELGVEDGTVLVVTDPAVPGNIQLRVTFSA